MHFLSPAPSTSPAFQRPSVSVFLPRFFARQPMLEFQCYRNPLNVTKRTTVFSGFKAYVTLFHQQPWEKEAYGED
jgi:hypothetical protein